MTSLGFPGLSSQSVSGFFGPVRPENTKTDWDDKPGLPRFVIPVRFEVIWQFSARKNPKRKVFVAFFGQKTPKRIGMTSLGFPGLSSQSVLGFLSPFRPEHPEMDWDDKPGLPRVVISVRFKVCWPFSARKPRNRLG